MVDIFHNLEEKFREIFEMGWVESINDYSSGVGMTFEKLLGKESDDFAHPDYDGIEIKTQRVGTDYPITIFGLAPWGNTAPEVERLRETYGYFDYDDKDQRKLNAEIYASKNKLICNRYFFNLDVNRKERKIYMIIYDINYNIIDNTTYWHFDDIEEKLKYKLQYLGFVHAASKSKFKKEYFKYFKLECYELKDFNTFLDLLEKNIIAVSFTSSMIKYGPSMGKYKASCYFRINKYDLSKLFTLKKSINLYNYNHY